MESIEITIIDVHPRTSSWLTSLLRDSQMKYRLTEKNRFLADGMGDPVLLMGLEPLRDWELPFLQQLTTAGFTGRVIGWIPGASAPPETVVQLLNLGVHALLPDYYTAKETAAAILECYRTGRHHNHLVGEALLYSCRKKGIINRRGSETILTERETRAVLLRAEGKSAYEIALALCVSKKTIDKLFFRMYQRTGHRNFFELYAALRKRLSGHFETGTAEPFPATNSLK